MLLLKRYPLYIFTALFFSLATFQATEVDAEQQSNGDLPKLGDSVSAVVSPETEIMAGRAWLRALRASTPIISDPLLNEYLETLIYRLAAVSELSKPDLRTVIVNSPTINAFAVPGGIVGINAGLLLNAETEDEMAAVLAHELAHLSQRHFARAVERAKKTQWASLAALLASVAIIAATGGGDPGLAALATTQAAAIQSQLRFSRKNEREADRMGMKTLVAANFDPHAMPRFFEKLQDQYKYYGSQLPEFLLTHPVTQSRISDSKNRAVQLQAIDRRESMEFRLMRARTIVAYSKDINTTITQYRAAIGDSKNELVNESNRYGLVRALLKAREFKEAHNHIDKLLKQDPQRITYAITKAEIFFAEEKFDKVTQLIKKNLDFNPNNYPLTIYYAQALLRQEKSELAVPVLERQLLDRPSNPYLWQLLAEAYGEAENIVGVHRAKAEVNFLHNQADQAIAQLQYALPLAKQNFQLTSKIESRIAEIKELKKAIRI